MPDWLVRVDIEHVDRQRTFTILSHINISSPIGAPPPAVIPGVPGACVGHRISLNISAVVRPDRKVDEEIGPRGILYIGKTLASKAPLNLIPRSLNYERIVCVP